MSAADRSVDFLLERAERGDRSAIGRLLDRHRDRLKAAVAARMDRRITSRFDPSDVVQESLAEAGRRLPAYLRDRELRWFPWLRWLTLQRLAELHRIHLRCGKRSTERELLAISGPSVINHAHPSSSGTSPSGLLIREEESELVRAALGELKEVDSRVLELRYYQGKSFTEIAAVLGVGLGAAKMRHFRALERFHRLLSRLEKDPRR